MSPTRLTLAFALLGTLLLGTAAVFGFERAAHGLDIAVEARKRVMLRHRVLNLMTHVDPWKRPDLDHPVATPPTAQP